MMVSNQPYLLRAFYDWIVDSHCTPHIVVNADVPGVNVPQGYVQDGRIILNVSMQAVDGLDLGNEWVTLHARFSGKSTYIEIPVIAIEGIFAKENGEGIAFQEASETTIEDEDLAELQDALDVLSQDVEPEQSAPKPKKPSLTIVK